jgi:hypothetical protein
VNSLTGIKIFPGIGPSWFHASPLPPKDHAPQSTIRAGLPLFGALHRECGISAAFRLRSPWSQRALTIQGWYPSLSLEVDMTRARSAGRNRRTSRHERDRMRMKDRRTSSQTSGSVSVQDETADVTIKTAPSRRGRSVDRSSIGPREDRRHIPFAKARLRREFRVLPGSAETPVGWIPERAANPTRPRQPQQRYAATHERSVTRLP